MTRLLTFTTLLCFLSLSSAFGVPINWANWHLSEGGATGSVMQNGSMIAIDYVGNAQWLAPSVNWYEGTPAPYTGNSLVDNAPTSGISNSTISSDNTMFFSSALMDPLFALYSVGSGGTGVPYAFDQPFTLLSEGVGNWGYNPFVLSGNTLTGYEGNGVIQFSGAISSISWDNPVNEFHHGFTLGVVASTGPAPVPEPATLILLSVGLAGLALLKRKRGHL